MEDKWTFGIVLVVCLTVATILIALITVVTKENHKTTRSYIANGYSKKSVVGSSYLQWTK